MRRFAFAVAFACAALGAAPLSAQFIPDGKWWKRPRISAAIDLSAEQGKQLDEIFARTRPKLIDLKADADKREFEFQQAMEEGSSTGVDRKAIAARVEAREEARAKLQKELVLMVFDMRQVLRPEQWERLTRMQQVIREQNQERRQNLREQERRLERQEGQRPRATQPPPPPRKNLR